MKRLGLILTAIFLPATMGLAQIVIGSGASISAGNQSSLATRLGIANASNRVDLSNLTLVMNNASAVAINNGTTTTLKVGQIVMNSSAAVRVNGPWEVTTDIVLTKGHLLVQNANTDQLVYSGSKDLAEGSNQSFITGLFFMEGFGSGSRSFPIGNADGYFPVKLTSVRDKEVLLGFEVIKGDPTTLLGDLSAVDVSEIMPDRYWQLTTLSSLSSSTSGGKFSGSPISLSGNNLDTFFPPDDASDPRIIQLVGQESKSIKAGIKAEYIVSLNSSVTGNLFAIGKKDIDPNTVREPISILEVLTPNDDNRNDVLYVDNIDLYPENKVTLLDRYGVKVKEWTNFDNVNPDFDFKTLGNGNYICIVQYTDASGASQKKTQMITVLK